MFFSEPQCTEVGALQLAADGGVEDVLVEPLSGRLWLISKDRQQVSVLDASVAESALKRQAAFLAPAAVHTQLVFAISTGEAVTKPPHGENKDDRSEDRITTVLFALRQSPDDDEVGARFAVIVTQNGLLITRALDAPTRPCAEHRLPAGKVCCSAALPPDACFDGYNVLVCLASDADCEIAALAVSTMITNNAHLPVRGLFRITGSVSGLLLDASEQVILCVTEAGAVDVWSWAEGADVSPLYQPMEYDTAVLGPPADGAVLLTAGHVWVGTLTGNLVRMPFRRVAVDVAASAAPLVTSAAEGTHKGPVRALLVMSLGTSVWSCGCDGKVCVWNAASGDLCGSFLFSPDSENSRVRACPPLVSTPLWAAHPQSGALTSFNVVESLAHDVEARLTTLAAQRASEAQSQELASLRFLVRCLVDACTKSATSNAEAAPRGDNVFTRVLAAAESLGDDYEEPVKIVVRALNDNLQSRALLRRYHSARLRQHPGAAPPLDGDSLRVPLQQLVDDAHRLWQLEDDVHCFMRQAAAILPCSTPTESLDDVWAALQSLLEPTNATAAKPDSRPDGTDDMPEHSKAAAAAATSEEVLALQNALQNERALRAAREQALSALSEENRELTQRVDLLSSQVTRGEEATEMLKRSLLASRKAAEAQSTEAAKLFGLEARLRESEERHAALERQVSHLRSCEETCRTTTTELAEARATLARYSQKEALAQRVIADFLHTQDEVDKAVQHTSRRATTIVAQQQRKQRTSTSSDRNDGDDLLNCILDLEDTIDEILHQQKNYIQDLKQQFLA